MHGSKGISRVHNLQSQQRKVLKSNCDDWFLILSPKCLGEIQRIHIFHDSTGPSPDWYCSKVLVYDLEGQKDYKFVVEKWFSLIEEDENIECFVESTPTLRSLRRDRIALDNVMFGLRETHLLFSIFTRHPRSSVTRSQRLSICLCIIMVHLLTSIMFYDLEDSDFPQYSKEKRLIIIKMESSFLASPFTFIVIFCFKKSRIVSAPKNNPPMTLTATQAVPLETGLEINQTRSNISHSTTQSSFETSDSFSSTSSDDEEEEVEEEEAEPEQEQVEGSCFKNFHQQIKALLFQVITSKAVMPVKTAEEDEESFQVRNQWMYFAWILCETTIIMSALFIVLYSLKMDESVCAEWMRDSLKYSVANTLLMAPLKIIIFATILAVLYGQLQYIPSYECNTEAAMKTTLEGNKRFLLKILKIRKNACYHPLKHKNTLIIRSQEKNWRCWRIVINFGVVILLYLVLTVEVLLTWDGLYLHTREHLLKMFDDSDHKITNFSSYKNHLFNVLPAIDRRTWYNGQPLMADSVWKHEMGYLNDYTTRLMGYPRLRQHRVMEDSCIVHPIMAKRFSQCNAAMTWTNMDKKKYSSHWTQPNTIDPEPGSPWEFSDSPSPLLLCGPKTTRCYSRGGYMVTLTYDQNQSKTTLENLFNAEWFDALTRVALFEMVIYNVNSEFICFSTLMLEKSADGGFDFNVKSKILHPRPSSFTETLVIISSFTFYYFLRIVLLFNRKGLAYLMSWTGVLDIFLNLLLYVTMISLGFYRQARTDYLHQWQIREEDDLQMTSDIFLHRLCLSYETAILVVIIPVQVLHNFRFGQRNLIFFKISTCCFGFAFVLSLLVWIYWFGFKLMNAVNNTDAVMCPFNRCYSPTSYFHLARLSHSSQLPIFTPLFCFITNIGSVLACVATISCYTEVKVLYKHHDDFNMFTFVVVKLKYAIRRLLKMRKGITNYAGKRFRAGADEGFITEENTCIKNRSYDFTKQSCSELNFRFNTVVAKLTNLEKSF